jgi:hypothetical protein
MKVRSHNMSKRVFALAALLCLVSASVSAQPQLIGEFEHADSRQRIIHVSGDSYPVAKDVKVTADGKRIVDPFLLQSGQPVGLSWRDVDGSRTITHIHVYDETPQ